MIKRIFVVGIAFFFVSAIFNAYIFNGKEGEIWAKSGAENAEEKKKEKAERERAKKEINEKLKNPQYYCAEALAELKEFKDFLWDTKKAARERAREELAKRIKVRVVSTVVDIIKSNKEQVEEILESKTQTYCDELLEEIEVRDYGDYPKKGVVTAIAYILENKYTESVERDLRNKKGWIITPLSEGIKAAEQKNFGLALSQFIKSRKTLFDNFEGIPMNEDITGDGKPEEIGGFLSARIGEIISHIEIKTMDEKIPFDNEGIVSKKPTVFVFYIDSRGKTPVSGIPLKVDFVRGSGNISKIPLQTGIQGDAQIPIESVNIDPTVKEMPLNVVIDRERLGLEKSIRLPSCPIILHKAKSIAYSINFFNSGSRSKPSSLVDSVKSLLANYEYGIEEYDIKGREVKEADIRGAASLNVDYLVHIVVSAAGGEVDYGMYYSNASSKAFIYSLPNGKIVAAIEGPSAKGYGTSVSRAGWDALGKVKSKLMGRVKEKIRELK